MRRLVSLLALAACGTDHTESPIDDPPPIAQTTWYQHAGPVIAEHCMGCHREGGIGPFSFETYDSAALYAQQMVAAVEAGVMPPWSATTATDCAPTRAWQHDPRLSASELDTLRSWLDDGTPAGDVATLTPTPELHLTGVTHELAPVEGFVASGATDQFMCVILDPQLATDKYLTGWDVLPSNPGVVHHVVVLPFAADALQAARNANVIGTPLPCDGIPMTAVLGAWTPGQGPMEFPDGVGYQMAANTGVLLQLHYHPANQINEPDATAIDLRLTDTVPQRLFAMRGWGNARTAPHLLPGPNDPVTGVQFFIPANVATHTETMRFPVTNPDAPAARTPMFVMQPHQHYIGTRLELRIHRANPPAGEPADECLVNSDWNFDWQRSYQYAVPIAELPTVGDGDEIEVKCTYNNTLANPFVQRALAEQNLSAPVDVFMGEQSLDEMCLGLVGLITDSPPGP